MYVFLLSRSVLSLTWGVCLCVCVFISRITESPPMLERDVPTGFTVNVPRDLLSIYVYSEVSISQSRS